MTIEGGLAPATSLRDSTSTDLAMMRAALALARRGLGTTWPNPSVGCVIVNHGHVVGREGLRQCRSVEDDHRLAHMAVTPALEATNLYRFYHAGDDEALADAMAQVLTDARLRMHLAHGARERAEQFTWRRVGDRIVDLYDRVLNAPKVTV